MMRDLVAAGWRVDVITLDREGLAPAFETPDGMLEFFRVRGTDVPQRALRALARSVRFLTGRRNAAPGGALSSSNGAPPSMAELDARIDRELWRQDQKRSLREHITSVLDGIEAWITDTVWSGRALRVARDLARKRSYRAVVVSSPPHYTQRVGARLSRAFGIPYIADYRDPWLLGIEWLDNYLNLFERVIARRREPEWLRDATVILHNTPRAQREIGARFPAGIRGRHLAVPNGYDSVIAVTAPDPECFRIVFTGWLYPYMDPRPLFAAAKRLQGEHHLGPDRLRIEFVGTDAQFGGVDLQVLAEAYGLGAYFTRSARVPRDQARRIQQEAAVMVAYDCPHPLSVPSKFYEYAQLSGSMLLLGNPDGAMADAAAPLGLRVCALKDQDAIYTELSNAYGRWSRGELRKPLDVEGRYDRRRQVDVVREILDSL